MILSIALHDKCLIFMLEQHNLFLWPEKYVFVAVSELIVLLRKSYDGVLHDADSMLFIVKVLP